MNIKQFFIYFCVFIITFTVFLFGCQDSSPKPNGITDENEIVLNDYQLTQDETWESDKTYIIDGTVIVPSDITLEILPGTVVKFGHDAQIKATGVNALLKIGTPLVEEQLDDPVLFTSKNINPQPGDWEGILFDITRDADSYLRGIRIEYAEIAVDIRSTSPSVLDCTLQHNETAIALNGSDSIIRYNKIINNQIGISTIERQNRPQIEYNDIKNSETGIFCENVQSIIQFNNLEINDFALRLNVKFDLNISNNWWGTTVFEDIDKIILDAADVDLTTKILGRVDYLPIAESRFADAGPRE